jgi:alpha-galactosidase
MAICLGALKKEAPSLKLVGVCHEVSHVASALMDAAKAAGLESPEHYGRLSLSSWGLNHCTFIDRASLDGRDLLALWLEGFRAKGGFEPHTGASIAAHNDYFRSEDRVKAFVLENLGVLPSAGDRHLVEFLPGYLRSGMELERFGVALTPVKFRRERAKASERNARDFLSGTKPPQNEPSGEVVLPLIQALSGQKELRASLVLPNEGQLPFLPRATMVETMSQVSGRGILPERAPPPHPYLARLLDAHAASYAKTLDFVWSGREGELIEALLLDPAAGLNPERAGDLARRIGEINRPWLESPDAASLAL